MRRGVTRVRRGLFGRSGEVGQSVVEFAIIAMVFFLIISGIVDFGRALNAWIVVSSSAREGARHASIGKSASAVTSAAREFALVPGVDPASVTVVVTYSASPPRVGDSVTVTVTANQFQIVTPLARAAFGCAGDSPTCYVPISSATTTRYEGAYIQ